MDGVRAATPLERSLGSVGGLGASGPGASRPFADRLRGADGSGKRGAGEASGRGIEEAVGYRAGKEAAKSNGQARCAADVSRRHANRTGDAQCTNAANSSGYCRTHEYLITRKGRSNSSVSDRYRSIGVPLKVSPVQAMISLLEESAGNVEFYRGQVEQLEKLVLTGRKTAQEIASMVVLYNEERDRFQRYTLDALRVNLEAKQVRLNKAQAEAFVGLVRALLDGLGLNGSQREQGLNLAADLLQGQSASRPERYQGPLAIAAAQVPAGARVVEESVSVP